MASRFDTMRAAVAQCRRHFFAAAFFSALVNMLYIAPTLYMLQVYDRVIPTRGSNTLLFLTIILIFSLSILSLLDRVRVRLLIRAGVQLDATLSPMILDATLGRPDLLSARQALREFDIMRAAISGPGVLALFDAPWMPIYIIICLLVHPLIGLLAILGCVALLLLAYANERATRHPLEEAQKIAAKSYASQEALLVSADSIRALGMRQAMVARQIRLRDAMATSQTSASFAAGTYLTATKFTRLALQSLALGLGALLAIDNSISAGAIFASSFLIGRALAPIEQLTGTWRTVVQARNSYRSLQTLLATRNFAPLPTTLPAPQGAITLEHVTVMNDTGDALLVNDVSLSIARGEVIAIVGPSGAGKSTLVRAISRAILPDRGSVRFDGADAGNWDAETLARHIGYLPQESSLFAGTIAENISRFSVDLGQDRQTVDAQIIAAAGKVGADQMIRELQNGYDHQLKLGGRGLSGGQTQRIALARAVYGDPRVLILDEPNAHLDGEGDLALSAALTRLKAEGATILIVSHKLGILPVVDKILLMRDGRADLFGARDEILARIAPQTLRVVPKGSKA